MLMKSYFRVSLGIHIPGSDCLYSGFLEIKKNKQAISKLPLQLYAWEFEDKI